MVSLVRTTAGQRFLDQVVSAYERSPLEVFFFVLAIAVPIVILSSYAVIKRRREIDAWTRQSSSYFIKEAEKRSLTPSQRDTLLRIAEVATKPWKRHTVFTEEAVFNKGASMLRKNQEVTDATVSALRLILGFTRHGGAPVSSASLPVGSRVAIAREGNETVVSGRVRAQKPAALYVTLDEDWPVLKQGKRVRILYQSRGGVFSFLTDILARKARTLALRHTETVGRSQRRKYYRRAISLPVAISLADWDDFAPATTVDLGGGGASIRPPEGVKLSAGDTVWVRFATLTPAVSQRGGTLPDRETTAVCTVVRTSEIGVHLKFTHIREPLRDRIIEQLFTDARSQTSESSREQ